MPDTDMPGYWMNETSGVLRPAVEAYLNGGPMTGEQVAAMRAYLRQWINAPVWMAPDLDALRAAVDDLASWGDINRWLREVDHWGIDPL